MRIPEIAVCILTGALFATPALAVADHGASGQGQVVVTILPNHPGEDHPAFTDRNLSVIVGGKSAKVTKWARYKSPNNKLELVLLIDDSARKSLGLQMSYIANFIRSLPPHSKVAVAYMDHGRAAFRAPLTSDHAQALKELRLPGGVPGSSASPYFCLSDLARHWPSTDPAARREVVMVTDGVDEYQLYYDPEDPYVTNAISDSIRARLVVYSIYWVNMGRFDRTYYANFSGQSLLAEVTDATGGKSYWLGQGDPVSFAPYFNDLDRRFRNQYDLTFESSLGDREKVESLKLRLSTPGARVDAPDQVLVVPTQASRGI